VLPYFQKLEDQEDHTNPLAGHGGPLRVASVERHDPNPVSRAFIDACIELGHPRTEDFNGQRMEGAGWHHVNIKDGRRHSDADAYLDPAPQREQAKPVRDRTLELIDGAPRIQERYMSTYRLVYGHETHAHRHKRDFTPALQGGTSD